MVFIIVILVKNTTTTGIDVQLDCDRGVTQLDPELLRANCNFPKSGYNKMTTHPQSMPGN